MPLAPADDAPWWAKIQHEKCVAEKKAKAEERVEKTRERRAGSEKRKLDKRKASDENQA